MVEVENDVYGDDEEVVEVRVDNQIIDVEVEDKRVSMANSNLMNVMQQVVDYQDEQAIEREVEEQKYEDDYQQQDYQYDNNYE